MSALHGGFARRGLKTTAVFILDSKSAIEDADSVEPKSQPA
jgi:hypothetical protein